MSKEQTVIVTGETQRMIRESMAEAYIVKIAPDSQPLVMVESIKVPSEQLLPFELSKHFGIPFIKRERKRAMISDQFKVKLQISS